VVYLLRLLSLLGLMRLLRYFIVFIYNGLDIRSKFFFLFYVLWLNVLRILSFVRILLRLL